MTEQRELRKNKILDEMRKELKDMAAYRRSPQGKREFILKWMEDAFAKQGKKTL